MHHSCIEIVRNSLFNCGMQIISPERRRSPAVMLISNAQNRCSNPPMMSHVRLIAFKKP